MRIVLHPLNSSLSGAPAKLSVITAAQQIEEIARVTRYPQVRARIVPAPPAAMIETLKKVEKDK